MDVVVARNFAVDAEITQNDGEGVTKLIDSELSVNTQMHIKYSSYTSDVLCDNKLPLIQSIS